MHGVKRLSQEKRLAKRKENEERAAAYRGRSKAAFERREKKQFDQESLDAIQKVVLENPDHATMWNFRREVLQAMHPPSAGDTEERKAACKAEFQLTQEGLQINPKSYPVWYHRQWVLEWGECKWQWPIELKLTAKFLALDDRNFHCWTYRRFVVQVAGVSAEMELTFTTQKVEANFSNYSAWHYRSKLLPKLDGGDGSSGSSSSSDGSLGGRIKSDLQLVRNAFFTAPEDSSAWFYHRWLLAQLHPNSTSSAKTGSSSEYAGILSEEATMVDELLELEPECKWALAAAVFLRREQMALDGKSDGGGAEDEEKHAERLAELKRVDPMRVRYYTESGGTAAAAAPVKID